MAKRLTRAQEVVRRITAEQRQAREEFERKHAQLLGRQEPQTPGEIALELERRRRLGIDVVPIAGTPSNAQLVEQSFRQHVRKVEGTGKARAARTQKSRNTRAECQRRAAEIRKLHPMWNQDGVAHQIQEDLRQLGKALGISTINGYIRPLFFQD